VVRLKHIQIVCAIFVVGVAACFGAQGALAANTLNPEVKVYRGDGAHIYTQFGAFANEFRGGVYVAAGDITGNGRDEIIAGAGAGGGPHVRVFGADGKWIGRDFFPFHSSFRGGVSVAAGDVDGDGRDELIFGQASLGQAWVKVYKHDGRVISTFMAYDAGFQGGVNVATGDLNGDGIDEIITVPAGDGRVHVRAFDRFGNSSGFNAFPFHSKFDGGASVASCDLNQDSRDEIVVAQARGGQAWVYVYAPSGVLLRTFLAYGERFTGGASVACADIDGDGRGEIITGAGGGGAPHVRIFSAEGAPKAANFLPYPRDFWGGLYVATGRIVEGDSAQIITAPRGGHEQRLIVGHSVEGRLIDAVSFGSGDNVSVFVGGTHAGTEPNTVVLMRDWIRFLQDHPWVVPAGSRVIVIENHNPDGLRYRSRYNARGVDLNRNFGTFNWSPIAFLRSSRVNPGAHPGSEPEVASLQRFLQRKSSDKLLTYHADLAFASAGTLVDGRNHGASEQLARRYNMLAGYRDKVTFDAYPITGDLAAWGAQILNIPSITMELGGGVEFSKNLPAMLDVL
jgi:hypothetical protein